MNSLLALLPSGVIFLGALILLLCEAFIRRENKEYLGYMALASLALSAATAVRLWGKDCSYFQGMLAWDRLAILIFVISIMGTALVVLVSLKYLGRHEANHGEYYGLLLLASAGVSAMISSKNLLVIYLGLEVLSISSYVLAGWQKTFERSQEASVKYFLLGSLASAFLVFGLAFVFGASGGLEILPLSNLLHSASGDPYLGLGAIGLIIAGLGFKMALVPFHMWAPDVYEGAPTPVTAYISVVPKIAGFAVLMRIFAEPWQDSQPSRAVFWAIWAIAALTMIAAGFSALRQTRVKRLLAYSSIAHSGYMIIALLSQDYESLIFYLVVYALMNIGAFASLIALTPGADESSDLDGFAGAGLQYPWIGVPLSLLLVSFAGFPPTGGFLAKFYVFSGAVSAGLVPLVVLAVLATLLSVYYYLKIVVAMYMRKPAAEAVPETENPALYLAVFLCLIGAVQLGIFPGNIAYLIRQAVQSLTF